MDFELGFTLEGELMTNDLAFARKHLDHNHETISILHHEKTNRTNEVCKLGNPVCV